MMVIELRKAALDKAFELLDLANDLDRQKKMILCELEDTLYDCFESDDDADETEDFEMPGSEDSELELRRRAYRYGSHSGMRRGMRKDDDMEEMGMRRRAMRAMRRRSGMNKY